MGTTHTLQEAQDAFEKLPPEIKKLLYSQEMAIIIQKVGEKNGLHIDQTDALYTETGQVMLGFSTMDEFTEDIADVLKVEPTKAAAIAQDVSDMLFMKVREAMKKPLAAAVSASAPAPAARPSLSSILPIGGMANTTPATPVISTPPAPIAAPIIPKAVPAAELPAVPKLEMHPADLMLTEKTVVTAPIAPTTPSSAAPVAPIKPIETKVEPPKPQDYKADPYREPIN